VAKILFITICNDFEPHRAMINLHAHLPNKGCPRFSLISDKILWIYGRFRQISPKSSVHGVQQYFDYTAIFDLYAHIDGSQGTNITGGPTDSSRFNVQFMHTI
jgi:hypothetical protein